MSYPIFVFFYPRKARPLSQPSPKHDFLNFTPPKWGGGGAKVHLALGVGVQCNVCEKKPKPSTVMANF